MKDMSLTVKYNRTDTGCLQVFILKDKKLLYNLTVFEEGNAWLDVPDDNKSQVNVYPDSALHRTWYREECSDCGWKSKPHEHMPVGLGGTLDCPECRKHKRNGPFIEGCYGNVDAIKLDWETMEPKVQ